MNSKGKYVEIHNYFIFDIFQLVKLIDIPNSEMFPNPFTGRLTMDAFLRHVHGMGLRTN